MYTCAKTSDRFTKVIKEKGNTYYGLLYLSRDKTILDTATYEDVCKTVEALRNSNSTRWYFAQDNPFEDVERLYQLKFKATLNNINYRVMSDLLIVNHETKEIFPIDLKTSSKAEWDFHKSFVEWNYSYQARLYWRVIRDNLDKDSYFKDFTLHNYRFIVANRKSLTPLVWECEFTKDLGTIEIGNYKFDDPEDIGKELYTYLNSHHLVPIGIKITDTNSLTEWLSK